MSSAKPLQIYKLENGKYRIDLNALNSILDKVGNRRVAIYSINGPLRNGKSFILGFFLKYLNFEGNGDWINSKLESTFTFRGGTKRETTGIFMWSEPFFLNKNGSEIALLLMDTQGSFDSETTMQQNALVFSLSTLLSSFIIFNIKEMISEDKLQFLQYFAGFARLADEDNKDEPFQKLIFLIRDWEKPDYEFGYYDENNSINGQNYKKDCIDVQQSNPQEVKYVHEMILSTFTDIGCYLMPHPGREVARNSNTDPKNFDPTFLDHLKGFIPLVLKTENIIEKKIGGNYVTGEQLKLFVKKWSEMFKTNKLPETKTIFEATAELQNDMAKTAAVDNYVRKMNEIVMSENNKGMDNKVLKDIHSQISKESLEIFDGYRKIGGKKYEEIYKTKIFDEILVRYEHFVQLNYGNERLIQVKTSMEDKCNQLMKETEENKFKLNNLKEENKVERNQLLRKIEESDQILKTTKDYYEKEMSEIKDQMAAHKKGLKDAQYADMAKALLNIVSAIVDVVDDD